MPPSTSHIFLRYTRLIHLYLGVFTAPALIFFAFTGALQTFSLHETTRGSSYKPPAWAVTLAQLHKKQTPVVPVKRTPASAPQTDDKQAKKPGDTTTAPAPPSAGSQHHPLPLKIFFLIVSVGLFISTISGIYMSYKYMRNRFLVTILLLFGTIIPIALALV
jgi:hypothetical protein